MKTVVSDRQSAIRPEYEDIRRRLDALSAQVWELILRMKSLRARCPHHALVFERKGGSFLQCPDCGEHIPNPLNPPDIFG